MKKYLIVIAAAAMLAGCAKTEVMAPDGNAPAEITFTTAPLTKALAAGQKTFSTSNVFRTYAYYTAGDFAYTASGEEFIPWTEVRHGSDDNWKTVTSYFWPKDGGCLSFFSWSLNTGALTYRDGTTPSVSFDATSGITLADYSCTGNDDFMVADPALSKTGNESIYEHHGVPTLFHHKTAQVKFKVKTKKAYDKDFTLTGISFTGVSTTGTYVQGNNLTGTAAIAESWTPVASSATTSCYSDATGMTFDENGKDVPSNGTTIFIPQTFSSGDGKTLTVTYKIGDIAKTATVSVNSMLGGDAGVSTAFQMGKIYTVTLVFSGSEILWDPYEVDWDAAETEIEVG